MPLPAVSVSVSVSPATSGATVAMFVVCCASTTEGVPGVIVGGGRGWSVTDVLPSVAVWPATLLTSAENVVVPPAVFAAGVNTRPRRPAGTWPPGP